VPDERWPLLAYRELLLPPDLLARYLGTSRTKTHLKKQASKKLWCTASTMGKLVSVVVVSGVRENCFCMMIGVYHYCSSKRLFLLVQSRNEGLGEGPRH
jgi:hypothetical protein